MRRDVTDLTYYVSATSLAIGFLHGSSDKQRQHVRHLIINEDKKSVALPECHAFGLVPYLQELPKLCVDRHVDIMNNM